MSQGFNLQIVAGNIGKDAQVARVGRKNTAKVTFSVAVNDGQERGPEWVRCVFWGERAEKLAPHLTRGTRVLVEGRQQTHTWEADGERKSRTELVVGSVEFRGYNRATFVGNLGADAEMVYLGEQGTPKVTFRLAANTGYGDYEHTEWVTVVIFGKRAESLGPHLTKGTRVLVSGELRTRSWEDKKERRHYRTELVVPPYTGELVFMNSRRDEADAAAPDVIDYPG
jgi:single stranded DNA-binding protein